MEPGKGADRAMESGRMKAMSRVGKTLVLVAAVLLVGAAQASAWEIVRPVKLKVPYSAKPGGEKIGKVSAETRGGEVAGFLLLEKRKVEGVEWYGVRIGNRPNDKVGWIQANRAYTVDARYRIRISLANRSLTLFKDGRRVWKATVIVGAVATPTPEGLFAVHDFYRVFDDLRPWVIETTAHSEVHETYLGGPARVAIHGRHGALAVPWGIRASNGCIRTPNWALRSLRRLVPVGTPIRVG